MRMCRTAQGTGRMRQEGGGEKVDLGRRPLMNHSGQVRGLAMPRLLGKAVWQRIPQSALKAASNETWHLFRPTRASRSCTHMTVPTHRSGPSRTERPGGRHAG
eukprot:351257-Chlamydomonas_euryale.AAC.2